MNREPSSTDRDNAHAIGVDVGGTGMKAAIVDTHGTLVESLHGPSPRSIPALRSFVHSLVDRAKSPLRGIGVGCKGIIDAGSTRVKSCPGDLCFLEGALLSEVVGTGDLAVCAENDARVALIGEVLWGVASGYHNVVMLTLGTGVGGAVLVNGKVLEGASGAAGHLGHTTIDPAGGLCICGNFGCLETRFSSRAIEADYWAHIHRAAPTKLAMSSTGEAPKTDEIFRAAASGDECARYVVDRALDYLGAALVSFLHTFDPDIFVLGGNIVAAGPQLIDPIKERIAKRTRMLLRREVPIVFQKTVGYGGVAGAAGLIFLKERLVAI